MTSNMSFLRVAIIKMAKLHKRKMYSLHCPPPLIAEIDALAEPYGLSRNALLECIILQFVNANK